MKRKIFNFMLLAVIVCLGLGMFVFTACGDNDGTKPTKPETQFTTASLVRELMDGVKGGGVGSKFGTDIDLGFYTDDKTAANADSEYHFVIKSNFDFTAGAAEDGTAFIAELYKQAGDAKEIAFGFAYEVQNKGTEPYFFINIANGGYAKINGYSLLAVVNALVPETGTGGFDITGIMPALSALLFGDYATKADGVYTFDFNLAAFTKNITAFAGILGETADTLAAGIVKMFGGLSYALSDGTVINVDSLDTLNGYVESELSGVTGKFVVKTDTSTKKITSAEFNADYVKKGEATVSSSFTFKPVKLTVGSVETNPFDGFLLDETARIEAEAHNLLNFSLNGVVEGRKADGSVLHTYDYSVNADLNAAALLALVADKNVNVKELVRSLGYFNLTFKDSKGSASDVVDIVIDADFTANRLIVNFDTHNTKYMGFVELPIALGGYYDIDALIDVIGLMTSAPAAAAADDAEEEGGLDIMSILVSFLPAIDLSNVHDNGVSIDTAPIVELLGGLLGDTSLIPPVLGNADELNVKVSGTVFGECVKTDAGNIKNTLRNDKATSKLMGNDVFAGYSKDFITEIVSADLETEYFYGDGKAAFKKDAQAVPEKTPAISAAKYKMTGKNRKGEIVNTTGFVMGSTLDPYKVGKQTVTVYFGIDSDLSTTLALAGAAMGLNLDPLIPLYGVLSKEYEITVRPEEVIHVSSDQKEVTDFVANDETAVFDSIAALDEKVYIIVFKKSTKLTATSADGSFSREYIVTDADMKILNKRGEDVTAKVLTDGIFNTYGQFTIQLKYNDRIEYSCDVKVDKYDVVQKNANDKPAIGAAPVEYELVETAYDGKVSVLTPTTVKYKVGYNTFNDLSGFCDETTVDGESVFTVKKNNDWYGKAYVVTITAETRTGAKTFKSAEAVMGAADGVVVLVMGNDPDRVGKSVNDFINVVYNGVEYVVKHSCSADGKDVWTAIDKDGNALTGVDVEVSITRKSDGVAATFTDNGMISNYDQPEKEGYTKTVFEYSVKVGETIVTDSFNFYALYASNKTSLKIGGNLNGSINTTSYLYLYDENGEKIALEFKLISATGKYAVTVKGTDEVVYDVDVKVFEYGTENEVSVITDGLFTAAGTYKVVYSTKINGIDNVCIQKVVVKA